jgi:hypothetical protein
MLGPERLTLKDFPPLKEACSRAQICRYQLKRKVNLIYFPPKLMSRDICAANGLGTATEINPTATASSDTVVTASMVLLLEEDIQPISLAWPGSGTTFAYRKPGSTTLEGDFTFTSPSIYVAHHPVTAVISDISFRDNGWSLLHTQSIFIKSAGVVPMSPDDIKLIVYHQPGDDALFSTAIETLQPVDSFDGGLKYAQLVAQGQYQPSSIMTAKLVPLNFLNFQNPVPARVYFDARMQDCWGNQTHCQAIIDDTYGPPIDVSDHIFSLPTSFDIPCRVPVLLDPPSALEMVTDTSPMATDLPILESSTRNEAQNSRRQSILSSIRPPQAEPGSTISPRLAYATSKPFHGRRSGISGSLDGNRGREDVDVTSDNRYQPSHKLLPTLASHERTFREKWLGWWRGDRPNRESGVGEKSDIFVAGLVLNEAERDSTSVQGPTRNEEPQSTSGNGVLSRSNGSEPHSGDKMNTPKENVPSLTSAKGAAGRSQSNFYGISVMITLALML